MGYKLAAGSGSVIKKLLLVALGAWVARSGGSGSFTSICSI